MKYYLAPMEGVTGYVFRQAYHKNYVDFDKYFTPFITPNKKRILRTREEKEVDLEINKGMNLVPQILTNDSRLFVGTARYLQEKGYSEINLNLGCPSSTVVPKQKGAGFLVDLKRLDNFFTDIFKELHDMKISVKTRLGMKSPIEFREIMKVYNSYPIEELIIHPRVREDFYQNKPNMEAFSEAFAEAKMKICYNGDIGDVSSAKKIEEKFPGLQAIMIGRGLVKNPALLEQILGKKEDPFANILDFHNDLLSLYSENIQGGKNVLFKMKELWSYWGLACQEMDIENCHKLLKKIKKSQNLEEYESSVSQIIEAINKKMEK